MKSLKEAGSSALPVQAGSARLSSEGGGARGSKVSLRLGRPSRGVNTTVGCEPVPVYQAFFFLAVTPEFLKVLGMESPRSVPVRIQKTNQTG